MGTGRRGLGGGCEPQPPAGAGSNPLAEALTWAMTRGPLAPYSSQAVVELGLGRRFTYIVSEGGAVGIAYAPQSEPLPSWLLEREYSLRELASLAWSHPALTSVALAAANAATASLIDEEPDAVCMGCDVVSLLGVGRGDRVALVGYIPGIASALRRLGAAVVVYEDNPMHRREAESEGFTAKPGVQLLVEAGEYEHIVATGSSLVTPLLHYAAARARAARALIGPTSSFHPSIAERLGYHVIGGSYVPPENRGRLVALVKLGLGFRKLRGLVVKWAWRRRRGERG